MKLEIALQGSNTRSVSVPTGLETVQDQDDEGDETMKVHKDVQPTQPKRAASALDHTGESPAQSIAAQAANRADIPSPMRSAARKRPSSVQIQSSHFDNVGDKTFGDETDRAGALARLMGNSGSTITDFAPEQTKATESTTPSSFDSLSRRASLMKPGVSYRIRPKRYSMTSTSGQQSATRERFSDMDSVPRLQKHEKMPTNSTEGGDILTPSTSMMESLQQERMDNGSIVHIDADGKYDRGSPDMNDGYEKADDRRLSTISTATVTFGQ